MAHLANVLLTTGAGDFIDTLFLSQELCVFSGPESGGRSPSPLLPTTWSGEKKEEKTSIISSPDSHDR
jgi:hypothetical protein